MPKILTQCQRPEVPNQEALQKRSNVSFVDDVYCYEKIMGVFDEFSWSGKQLFTLNRSEVCKQWDNALLVIKTDFYR